MCMWPYLACLPWGYVLMCLTAWMPVGESLIAWIETTRWLWVLSPLEVAKSCFSKPTRGWQIRALAYLRVTLSNHFQKQTWVVLFKFSMIESILVCCAHHIVRLANKPEKEHMCFQNQYSLLAEADLLIGRAGVLISWPSPLVLKFLSRGNFGDDGHVALGTSQGFLNIPKQNI